MPKYRVIGEYKKKFNIEIEAADEAEAYDKAKYEYENGIWEEGVEVYNAEEIKD